MAVFPAIDPIYPASKQGEQQRNKILLGDGYESSIIFGLNTPQTQWSLTWLVEQDQADQIEGFLQARADAGEWFEWQPPDSATALRFRCDEWTVEQDDPMVYRISASFRRVFELELITLTPSVSNECYQDELCNVNNETISGTVAGGFTTLGGPIPTCADEYIYVKITYIKEDGSTINEYYNLSTGNVTVGGSTYAYSLDSTTVETTPDTWTINRWLDYFRTGYKIAADTQCSTSTNPTTLTWPTYSFGDPTLFGPITSEWAPTNGGYPLVYTGTGAGTGGCEARTTCLKWEASGYGQTSFIQVCRGVKLTQFGPAFWGGFGGIGDPSQTYKYPQFYYTFCDGYSWQVVNNGGAIYLPYAGARLPEFHLSVYYP